MKLLLLEQKKKESSLTSKYNLKIVKIKKVTESLIADINTRKQDFLDGMKAITKEQKDLEKQKELKKGLHEFLTRFMEQEKAKQSKIKERYEKITGQELVEASWENGGGSGGQVERLRKKLAKLKK